MTLGNPFILFFILCLQNTCSFTSSVHAGVYCVLGLTYAMINVQILYRFIEAYTEQKEQKAAMATVLVIGWRTGLSREPIGLGRGHMHEKHNRRRP